MNEGASIAGGGFIDRNRFRARFDEADDVVYERRAVSLPKPRVAQDINSPDLSSRRKHAQVPVQARVEAQILKPELRKAKLLIPILAQAIIAETGLLPVYNQEESASVSFKARLKNLLRPIRFFFKLFRPNNRLQLGLTGLAVIMVLGGLYMSFVGWQTNQTAKTQAVKLTAAVNKASTTGNGSSNVPAISTVKPAPKTVAAYAVAPGYPKYLKIPSIGVDAMVGQVGLLANGALGTPDNVYDTDWYTGSAEPGQAGATLIDGHVSSWTANGVFYKLHLLKPGDAIQIVKGDNSVVNYQVVQIQVYNSANVDMQAAITPIVSGVSGLNLITCTGDVIKGTSQFNERVIVFAKEV